MPSETKKQRVIVYIDGYNLYYGMRTAFGRRYQWLDLQALAESLLRPGMTLISVKYFTAISKGAADSRQRQQIYLKALESHCDKLEIYYGHFLRKKKQCRSCGVRHTFFEEKKTDVNIACQILNDTHLNRCDCAYIVSGDSDLVPPLQIVKENHPNKHTFVAHPPRRKSVDLCETANAWFAISKHKLTLSQLPESLVSQHGNRLTRPPEWR